MMLQTESVARWGEVKQPSHNDGDTLAEMLEILDGEVTTPYLMNEELNFRIALWQGDLTALRVDAIVSGNNEELNERAGVSGALLLAAGPQMEEACKRLGGCSPGNAKVTRGFRLPAKHVIHTVPPSRPDGFDEEQTLERCYVSSFDAAMRLHCTTVAFSCIKNSDTPREQAAHVALRAVRRMLEQPAARSIQLVLFAMRPQDVYDAMVYENLLPLYFPRSAAEEHEAVKLLPLAELSGGRPRTIVPVPGAEDGKRCVRAHATSAGAAAAQILSSTDFASAANPAFARLTKPPLCSCAQHVPDTTVAASTVDASLASSDESMLRGSSYASFLQRAGLADLSDIEAMQLFYRGGVDARGRPVFLFWAGHLPSRPVDLERVIMHLMRTLDAHAHSGYSIVYIHTTLSPENEPPFAWLRKVYDIIDQRLKDNLHLVYVIHASWWLKMAMNFLRTFVASGRFWESKVIQLPHFADLFKRNYFAPGSLRMPETPLVRKYLEMSNDVHLLEAITGNDSTTCRACADAFTSAASAGVIFPLNEQLNRGLLSAECAATATAAPCRGGHPASQSTTQVQSSKDVLLQQLVELSDQVAQSRAHSDAVQVRHGQMQTMKDREINRLSEALSDAQRDADRVKQRLEQVHNQAVVVQDERRGRQEILAELADLEGQLAQTQVYNHHMANELVSLRKHLRDDKWALLHEMSSLERQLEAARAAHFLRPTPQDASMTEVVGCEHARDAFDDPCSAGNKRSFASMASRVEQIACLHSDLVRGRNELAFATRILNEEHGGFECALKRAADEMASVRGVEQVRESTSAERHRELQSVASHLGENIAAIRTAARLGLESASESAETKSTELGKLEAIVSSAAEDVGRMEQRLAQPSGDACTLSDLQEMQASLTARLIELDEQTPERLVSEVALRRDGAMLAVAQQFVPQMNQKTQDQGTAKEDQKIQDDRHDAQLTELEAKAAHALASLEQSFETEVKRCDERARAATAERRDIRAKLDVIEVRIRTYLMPKTAAEVQPGSRCWPVAPRALAPSDRVAGVHGIPLTEWSYERLALFFNEAASQVMLRALLKWRVNASYIGADDAGGGSCGSRIRWAQVRADKVALVRKLDEQAQEEADAPVGLTSGNALKFADLHQDLNTAHEELGTLRQRHDEVLRQLHGARTAAQHLANEVTKVSQHSLRPHILALTAELNRELPFCGRVLTPRRVMVSDAGGDSNAVAAGSSCPDLRNAFGEEQSLELTRVGIEANLVEHNDALAEAEAVLGVAEHQLESVRGHTCSVQVIEAQRVRDEAKDAREAVEVVLKRVLRDLQELQPSLMSARHRHVALRHAPAVVHDVHARNLTNAELLQVLTEVLQERLQNKADEAQSSASFPSAPRAEPACLDRSGSAFLALQAQCEQAVAELRLEFGAEDAPMTPIAGMFDNK